MFLHLLDISEDFYWPADVAFYFLCSTVLFYPSDVSVVDVQHPAAADFCTATVHFQLANVSTLT